MADPASIKSGLMSAFRDFEVEGVPASGVQEPVKAEVRAALGGLADRVEEVASSVTAGVLGYNLVADLPVLAPEDEGILARVAEDGNTYRWDGEAWQVFDDPLGLVKPDPFADAQVTADLHGFVLSRTGPSAAMVAGMTTEADPAYGGLSPTDRHGFRSGSIDEEGGWLAGLRFVADVDEPGVVFTDRHGFLLQRVAGGGDVQSGDDDTTIYFSSLLCGVAGETQPIYLRNLRSARTDTAVVTGTVCATGYGNAYSVSGRDELSLLPEALGAAAQLSLRTLDVDHRTVLPLAVQIAPNPAVMTATFNVLGIGDSIWNRQGGELVAHYLRSWGYDPSFIGTMRGSNSPSGELGEGREGWETGDYINALTARGQPVAPGDEAAYLAMDATAQRDFNPFIREATGADDPGIVRNGYVLDFSFYQTRFGLSAPDVILYGLGTNDTRTPSAAVIQQTIRDNDLLILSRIRAAWPDARIVRYLPGQPRETYRDDLWRTKYVPALRGMMLALSDLADPLISLCPSWALVSQEVGYALDPATADPATGSVRTTLADATHPIGCARAQLFKSLAAYVACAAAL